VTQFKNYYSQKSASFLKEPWRRQFRSDLFKLYNRIKGYNPHIVELFNQLAEAYPELNASYAFPDEVKDEGIEEDTTEQLQTGKKK